MHSRTRRTDKRDFTCNSKNCYLCTNGLTKELATEFYLKGWHRRIVPVFVFLERTNNKEWQHLSHDVFPFIAEHWNILWPQGSSESPHQRSWKESVKALVSRKKHIFESGKSRFGTRGYWQLRPTINKDTFTSSDISDDERNSSNKSSAASSPPSSPEISTALFLSDLPSVISPPVVQVLPPFVPLTQTTKYPFQVSTVGNQADYSLSTEFIFYLKQHGIKPSNPREYSWRSMGKI